MKRKGGIVFSLRLIFRFTALKIRENRKARLLIFMENIRHLYLNQIEQDLSIVPICALLGPRQCGKTTLARQYAKQTSLPVHYFDLEDYTDLARLAHPKLTLEPLTGLIIIDEIQRMPDLFPYLRVLADRPSSTAQFLILGSASKELIHQSSESLAGRISYIEVTPFSLIEVQNQRQLWLRGGFPRSYLGTSDHTSQRWRTLYMQTYFEKDLKDLGLDLSPQRIIKLWHLLTQYHGSILNYANMAQLMEISIPTLKNYLDILEGTFMIRTLHPWFENKGKRLVKTPKIYVRDPGIYHQLLHIQTFDQLLLSKELGNSWEGFALEEILKHFQTSQSYFWATHQQAELDLFIIHHNKRMGFEFKATDKPKITKSMRSAIEFLNLDMLYIVTPIESTFPLEDKVQVMSLLDCCMLTS